jgi:hypothetical protein
MGGLNLLVCDLTDAKTAVTAMVPVTRTYGGDGKVDHGDVLGKARRVAPTGLTSDGAALDKWVK